MILHKKTGLFFGSFNPIHNGHLIIAEQILTNSDLDDIWFVISPQNPLKEKSTLLDNLHRLALVKTAIDDNSGFKACDIEFKMPLPSYTIHTLLHLEEKYPTHKFALIIGSDNLYYFNKWFNYEQILNNFQLYVYPRPNYLKCEYKNHPSVKWVNAPLIEISSSYIRDLIRNGKSIRYLVPESVANYIQEMHFYKK